jgi:formylglycine-generating enzyme required for sulfatase activity
MKTKLFIGLVTAAVFICFMSCENPVIKSWWEEQETVGNGGSGNPDNNPVNNPDSNPGNNPDNNPSNNPDKHVITITGLFVNNKTYDEGTYAWVLGTPVLNGIVNGDDVTLVRGSARFSDPIVGNDKEVILSGWGLSGADADNYVLQMPTLTAHIVKDDPFFRMHAHKTLINVLFAQTLADVKPPPYDEQPGYMNGVISWTNPDTLLKKGLETYLTTFTPEDTHNYNIVKDFGTTVNLLSIYMNYIPNGTFLMGSPAGEPGGQFYEGPQHSVTLTVFSMSTYPVMQELYDAVMDEYPSINNHYNFEEFRTPFTLPVDNVSWYDAIVFCNKLSMMEGLTPAYRIPAFNNSTNPEDWGAVPNNNSDPNIAKWDTVEMISDSTGYRLPTEAQWEYACRAGTTTMYSTGDAAGEYTGWNKENSEGKTHRTGLKANNRWGLYDMHGNVREWCWDRFDNYTGSSQTNPTGPSYGTKRVTRGGSYEDDAVLMRSAARNYAEPYTRSSNTGFRIARPYP